MDHPDKPGDDGDWDNRENAASLLANPTFSCT
jgi:hypothetical protein